MSSEAKSYKEKGREESSQLLHGGNRRDEAGLGLTASLHFLRGGSLNHSAWPCCVRVQVALSRRWEGHEAQVWRFASYTERKGRSSVHLERKLQTH